MKDRFAAAPRPGHAGVFSGEKRADLFLCIGALIWVFSMVPGVRDVMRVFLFENTRFTPEQTLQACRFFCSDCADPEQEHWSVSFVVFFSRVMR